MTRLELPIYLLSFVLFFAGIFFMHIRLRSKSSLILVLSFSSLIVCFFLTVAYQEHLLGVSEHEISSEAAPLSRQDSAETTAEAFSKLPLNTCLDCTGSDTLSNFDVISKVVLLILLLTSCISFFFSAKSVPRLTTQSR